MHRKDEEHSGMEAIVHDHGIIKILKRNLQHSGSLSIRKGLELTIYHPNSTVLLGLAINSLTVHRGDSIYKDFLRQQGKSNSFVGMN
jgi:hypothetical protein